MKGKDFIYFVIGLIVLYAFGQAAYQQMTGTDPKSVVERTAKRNQEAAQAAEERRVFEKEDARRSFALRESPVLWQTIEDLKSRIVDQNGRLAKLKKTFDDLGMAAASDKDYQQMVEERDAMVKRLRQVEDELDRAYLESVKYEVTQGRRAKVEFDRHAREDGLAEAEISRQKYESMRKNK